LAAEGQAVQFKGDQSTSDTKVASYLWAFPDGSFSKEANAKFIFLKGYGGNQSVSLTVKSNSGQSQTSSFTLFVTLPQPTMGDFTYTDKTLGVSGQTEPNAFVTFFVFSNPKTFITQANADGRYSIEIPLANINKGTHRLTAVALKTRQEAQRIAQEFAPTIRTQVAHAAENTSDDPRIITDPKVLIINQNPLSTVFLSMFSGGLLVLLVLGVAFYFHQKRPPSL
jgi:hypothetical protein